MGLPEEKSDQQEGVGCLPITPENIASKNLALILAVLFLTIFLFLGAGKAFDHRISHSFPAGMFASDAYTHNWVSQNLYDQETYNLPPASDFENDLGYQKEKGNYKLFHPPILPFISASIAKLSGIQVYSADTIFLFLAIALMVMFIYFIIAHFNETLALFSLPLCLLFIQKRFFISFGWGWWNFLIAEFFLIALMLLILSPRFKHRYFLIGILFTAAFMSHGVELGYAAIFIIFYLVFVFFTDRREFWPLIKEQIKSSLVFMVFGGYYLILLFRTMGAMGYHQIRLMSNSAFMQQVYAGTPPNYFIFFSEFAWLRIVLVLGLIISIYLLFKNKNKVIAFAVFVVFMSLSPYLYIMAGERGFQWRFLWPIYLAMAFGAVCFLIYSFLGKFLRKNETQKKRLVLKIVFFVLSLSLLLWLVLPMLFMGEGAVGKTEMEAYGWVHQNTDQYARIFVMYAPQNSQITSLYLLKRELFVARPEVAQNMDPKSSQVSSLINPKMTVDYFCRKEDCSLFSQSHFLEYRKKGTNYYENRSVCSFDYIFLSLKNYEEFNKFNLAYLQNLINKRIYEIVFNNQAVIVAKKAMNAEECEVQFKP